MLLQIGLISIYITFDSVTIAGYLFCNVVKIPGLGSSAYYVHQILSH